MKGLVILGIVLVVLGIVSLVYEGITYKKNTEVIDFGPLEAHVEETKKVPLPPVVGIISIAAGVVLVAMGVRRPSAAGR